NAGRAISFGTTAWKPNERIVGMYRAQADVSRRAGWRLIFETLTTTPKAMHFGGNHRVGSGKPVKLPKSAVLNGQTQAGLSLQTVAMATIMSERGTSIAVANSIPSVWAMARKAKAALPKLVAIPVEIQLVRDFLKTEVGPAFELVEMLQHGVAVHHAGLSDEIRGLIEWLAEQGKLRVLCATSTVAQGINFPVSSVFLSSRHVYQDGRMAEMSPREFWNLAGRAGRIGHDSVGVIGLAEGRNRTDVLAYVSKTTGALASRL